MRIELDKKSLFALASDTRLEILKSLQPMRRTVSQLADSIEIDKAAIHRHLKKLEEGDLVKRYEDHGFVYYGLSWKARDLLSPNDNTKIIILLSCSWLLIFGAAFFLALGQLDSGGAGAVDTGEQDLNHSSWYEIAYPGSSNSVLWWIPTAAFIIGAISMIILAVRRLRRPKQGSSEVSRST